MPALRTLTLRWDIQTGKLRCDCWYFKREERIDVDLKITNGGAPYALDSNWGLNLTLKPQGMGDNDALVAITSWSASATLGLYQATAQAISSTELDTWLLVNADTSDDVESKYGDIDVYYTIAGAMKAKSDTMTVTVKPDVGRTDDGTPITTAVSITASGYTMSTARLLGRTTAGTGAIEEISAGTGISLAGGVISATGAGTDWGDITGTLASQTDLQSALDAKLALAGGDMTGALNAKGANVAATTTLALGSVNYAQITGSGVTITGIADAPAGAERETVFLGINTLTHNAVTFNLLGEVDITTAVGDVARWRSVGTSSWRMVSYHRQSTGPSAEQAFVDWERLGFISDGTIGAAQTGQQEQSVVVEGSSQLGLSGTVLKCWFTSGFDQTGIGYRESITGMPGTWVYYESGGQIANVLANYKHARVCEERIGGYLYMSACASTNERIDILRSSDGITWTVRVSNAVVLGGSGTWDESLFGNSRLHVLDDGSILLDYEASGAAGAWVCGIATAPTIEGTYTKYAGNPTIVVTDGLAGGPRRKIIGSTHWMYIHGTVEGGAVDQGVGTDLFRMRSTGGVYGPWVFDPEHPILERTFIDGGRHPGSQLADVEFVDNWTHPDGRVGTLLLCENLPAQGPFSPSRCLIAFAPYVGAELVAREERGNLIGGAGDYIDQINPVSLITYFRAQTGSTPADLTITTFQTVFLRWRMDGGDGHVQSSNGADITTLFNEATVSSTAGTLPIGSVFQVPRAGVYRIVFTARVLTVTETVPGTPLTFKMFIAKDTGLLSPSEFYSMTGGGDVAINLPATDQPQVFQCVMERFLSAGEQIAAGFNPIGGSIVIDGASSYAPSCTALSINFVRP